ncbi:MAG TPA: ThuA domain-containing protein [Candidatus Acidoferrum sp.]|nr:ThuA domain-containing protein [Candidatus Acidoferrum sp.]
MKTMRGIATALAVLAVVVALAGCAARSAANHTGKIRVLLVTGGHGFEREPFLKLFRDNPEITCTWVEHPNAHTMLTAEASKSWDVLVMYDFNQKISEAAQADFLARLKEGKGLVVLHHAIAAYPEWPEYWNIVGAHYYLAATNVAGVAKKRSGWKEGLHFRIHVADPAHPVTRGMTDFDTHDEAYKWFDVSTECHPLWTTDEAESNKVIAWAKSYKGARVVYIQSGHDHFAYENPNYQQMVRQAIEWVARR